MTTAREFCEFALREAGVVGLGQTAKPQDINGAFRLLHMMLAGWQKQRWLVPNLIDTSAIANGLISNKIGPGQHYNAMRPDKIQSAYFKQISPDNEVSYPLIPIWSYEDYVKIQMKNLESWPVYYFYDNAFPYGNVFIWPIPSSDYQIHLITKGPINFTMQLLAGEITAGGAGYTDGAYLAVPFINVSSLGGDGTADVTVAGGVVTAVTIAAGGDGYKIGDVLSFDTAIIGAGAGVLWRVNNVTDSLDAVFNMPPEYEEAIHYNLCVRLVAHYQYTPNPVQGKLAVLALNRLKNSNSQISKLQMPGSLRFSRGNSFYIYNADAN